MDFESLLLKKYQNYSKNNFYLYCKITSQKYNISFEQVFELFLKKHFEYEHPQNFDIFFKNIIHDETLKFKSLRVREIIKHAKLSDKYDELVKEKIIPDINKAIQNDTQVIQVKKYKKFVYDTKSFSFYGIFIDYLVRFTIKCHYLNKFKIIIGTGDDPLISIIQSIQDPQLLTKYIEYYNIFENGSKNWVDGIFPVYELVCLLHNCESNPPYTKQNINSLYPYLQMIMKSLVFNNKEFNQKEDIVFNAEYSYKHIQGHPDIICHDTIFDIKNMSKFTSTSKESILQVLAYFTLEKILHSSDNMQYIGFILPMQETIFKYDLENWNCIPFFNLLNTSSKSIIDSSSATSNNNFVMQLLQNLLKYSITSHSVQPPTNTQSNQNIGNFIGSHVSKTQNMKKSIESFYSCGRPFTCPIQMCLSNTHNAKRSKKTEVQVLECFKYIKDNNISYFTHAPYSLNLCIIEQEEEGVEREKDLNQVYIERVLKEELDLTSQMNGKGLVVHTGSRKSKISGVEIIISLEEATKNMEYIVRNTLTGWTYTQCKLLLETPCGEGMEICASIIELNDFFNLFSKDEKDKLGICIDTCHVFASGVDPLEYIKNWNEGKIINFCNIPISLVHFNDSATKFGSKTDRHSHYTRMEGYIGNEKMMEIANYCITHNIPMVTE
jgi:deoxyribonuclease-4